VAVEDDADALYAADPDEFVAARQALVKRLRADGDRAQAAEVAKLRRPTAAAWAVNQLARRHPDELAGLVELGRELGRAHERLLSGGRDDATITSGRRRREAIVDLVDRAAGILTGSGRAADAHRDAIAATLDAASLDPEVAADVVAGRLSKELDPPSGFGLGGGELDRAVAAPAPQTPAPSTPNPSTPKPSTPKPSTPPPRARAGGAAAAPADSAATAVGRPAAVKTATVKAEAAGGRAEQEAAERARRAAEAQERAAEAQERAAGTRKRAATARTAATRARDLAEQALEAADHAERERDRLEAEVVRARRTANDTRRASRELRAAAREAERQASALEQEAGT